MLSILSVIFIAVGAYKIILKKYQNKEKKEKNDIIENNEKISEIISPFCDLTPDSLEYEDCERGWGCSLCV